MKNRAFTLIELLASMAVFFIVVVAGLSLLTSTSTISRKAKLRVDIREEARSVFDRMALDFSSVARFDNYQLSVTGDTNSIVSLLTMAGEAESIRLRRIDYFVENGALYRAVSNLDWDGNQDLSDVSQGSKELLSPLVGRMLVGTFRADNTSTRTESKPPTRGSQRPVGISVALVMTDARDRSQRSTEGPSVITNSSNLSVSLPDAEAVQGWRLYEKAFRLP